MRGFVPKGKERKMETRAFGKSSFSSVIHYSILIWTVICFMGTWLIILKYGVLWRGLIAVAVTFFFAAAIWAIPFAGLIFLSLYATPPEEPLQFVMFEDMIRKGMKQSPG